MNRKLAWILAASTLAVTALLICGAIVYAKLPTPPVVCEAHADADNDGLCDTCAENVLVEIDVYAINDLHGKFLESSAQPGVDELTTYLRENGTNKILLSSGDMWQGSSESNLSGGNIITDWMNEMGFVSMTLGNHEFDWGTDFIEDNAKLAEFPILAINVYSHETDACLPYCQPSVMIERAGVKIGIIGAVGDVYSSVASYMTTNVYFVTGSALSRLVKAEAQKLREAGADLIIFSIHDGFGQSAERVQKVTTSQIYDYYDITLSDYVDLVFEGHTHQHYVLLDSKGVYHLQGGGENRGISHADIRYNTANGTHTVKTAEFISNTTYSKSKASGLTDELLDKYLGKIAKGNDSLGINPVYRDADYLKTLIAELYLKTGIEKWGEQYQIFCGGGFISIRSPYGLDTGHISYSNLQMLFPFDNRLVLCSVEGRYLRSQFLETDNSNYFVCLSDYGKAMRDKIDDNALYYIIIDRYSSQYKPNNCTEIVFYTDGVYARDLLATYFRETLAGGGEVSYTLTSIPDIQKLGKTLNENARTSDVYYVQAKIKSIENSTYGNVYLVDDAGNTLYVYGINSLEGGLRFDQMKDQPKVGDIVILSGVIQRYISGDGTELIEMYKAVIVEKK